MRKCRDAFHRFYIDINMLLFFDIMKKLHSKILENFIKLYNGGPGCNNLTTKRRRSLNFNVK